MYGTPAVSLDGGKLPVPSLREATYRHVIGKINWGADLTNITPPGKIYATVQIIVDWGQKTERNLVKFAFGPLGEGQPAT